VHAGRLHATLAGVVLAALIDTTAADYRTLMPGRHSWRPKRSGSEQYAAGPQAALQAIDAIDRLESPADRMLRTFGPRSSYLVLPVFALANAGVAIDAAVLGGHGGLMLAIGAGLVLGKPLGFIGASWLAVRFGLA
jgi:NhaA family Na+:H+ antiporter